MFKCLVVAAGTVLVPLVQRRDDVAEAQLQQAVLRTMPAMSVARIKVRNGWSWYVMRPLNAKGGPAVEGELLSANSKIKLRPEGLRVGVPAPGFTKRLVQTVPLGVANRSWALHALKGRARDAAAAPAVVVWRARGQRWVSKAQRVEIGGLPVNTLPSVWRSAGMPLLLGWVVMSGWAMVVYPSHLARWDASSGSRFADSWRPVGWCLPTAQVNICLPAIRRLLICGSVRRLFGTQLGRIPSGAPRLRRVGIPMGCLTATAGCAGTLAASGTRGGLPVGSYEPSGW